MRDETSCGRQDADSIFHAAPEVDGRSFFEVARRAGDLADSKAEHHTLGEHLIVEDEVVRVLEQREGLQHLF